MTTLQRTPLFPLYAAHPAARCIDFGGWELPVQFSSITQEHEAVRQRAGLFDVSHMGEFYVSGSAAQAFLQYVTTNDVTRLENGQAQYSLLCYPDGGVVDDLLVYRIQEQYFMLVVNASNIEKDWSWLQRALTDAGDRFQDGVVMENASEQTALLAVQGPAAVAIVSQLTDAPVASLAGFRFVPDALVSGVRALVSRTGYTGEDGFELYVAADDAPQLWQALLQAGAPHGLVPAGLGARDTLRFEAKLPLYGQELSAHISPLEAGLQWFVKLDTDDFIGREALIQQKTAGLPRKLVGIEMIDRGIPRSHYAVYNTDGKQIGEVTTGTQSPTLKRNLGLALIDAAYSTLDTDVFVDVRGKQLKARVIKAPFYKRTPSQPAAGTHTDGTHTEGAKQ
ncbi:glycine cleavage system aminomethyltransferase GcvT [Paenibacillus sp. 481]|uniref:glycine cleavage system aminomethyltransferase GcvT n=1 Tax=Paenibacillus sp. 481 TaxID=2835869 RepID=UPI001E4FEE75|nr:glycine cleavage system aminomethyltransferase GcvT [Paenibacillus sp. 481]UHA73568.1 glycine cleavage system aminomethyltransferase GcvT [Paenibacillus sp. 481]